MFIDESFLLVKIADRSKLQNAIQSLIKNIKQNVCTRKNIDMVYQLKEPLTILPKANTTAKKISKWETFAEKKGIEKKKRSFFVYDEDGQKEHRFGALSVKNKKMRCGIYNDGESRSKLRKEKEQRVKKNLENRERNNSKAGCKFKK
ncbi:Rhodanese- sulfurtransferase [Conglomerata obtusa]